MALLTDFYSDILKIIITFLDEECIMMARTCKRIYDLVHNVRPTMLLTNNIFEAVRCGSLLSFKYAHANPFDLTIAASMHSVTNDMLIDAYGRIGGDSIAYRLCKRGISVEIHGGARSVELIMHAIRHNNNDLLECIKKTMIKRDYDDRHKRAYSKVHNKLTNRNHTILRCIRHAMKTDNVDEFPQTDIELIHQRNNTFMKFAIKYNAINIVRKYMININHVNYDVWFNHTCDMTLEMAELLLELTNNDKRVVNGIINSRNYRLTEMLRTRGLYDKELTVRSSHIEFTT